MPKLHRLFLAACLAVAAGSAAAEPSKAARAYVEAMRVADSFASLLPDLLEQEEALLRQAMPGADEEAIAAFMGHFADELEARLPAIEEGAAEIMDRVHTEDELRGITAFLETDLGRRYVEGGVSYQQDSRALGRAWMSSSGQQAAARHGKTKAARPEPVTQAPPPARRGTLRAGERRDGLRRPPHDGDVRPGRRARPRSWPASRAMGGCSASRRRG